MGENLFGSHLVFPAANFVDLNRQIDFVERAQRNMARHARGRRHHYRRLLRDPNQRRMLAPPGEGGFVDVEGHFDRREASFEVPGDYSSWGLGPNPYLVAIAEQAQREYEGVGWSAQDQADFEANYSMTEVEMGEGLGYYPSEQEVLAAMREQGLPVPPDS